jgi:predicted ATP-grasp superfamily ATP-dependent carboligase
MILLWTEYKKDLAFTIMRWEANLNKFSYFAYETLRALFPKRKIKILFSKYPERESDIKKSFRLLNHEISFDEFTPENIQKNELIVPFNMDNLRQLIVHQDLAQDNPIPTPTTESVNICDDKFLFYKTMVDNDFEQYMPRIGNCLKIPFILKKKVSHMGLNCYIVDTPEKEKNYSAQINDPDYFCQEIIPGPKEYATHLLFKGGKTVAALNVTYIFSTPTYVKGVDKFICNKLGKCPHLNLFEAMLSAIGFEGLCCLNYKEINGKPYILEINPRFGGSLSMFFFSFLKHIDPQ